MKTIEEKAKAYNEVLEKAKEIVNDPNASSVWKGWLCNCFLELKESEDEKIRKGIFKALSKKDARDVLISQGIEVSDALAWLERQGEKKLEENKENIVEISPNSEWSEEDKKILKEIISDVKFEGYNNDMQADSYKKIAWLKSLRPQNRWKPSDEQMMALLYHCSNGSVLTSLYNDLNKLKEE